MSLKYPLFIVLIFSMVIACYFNSVDDLLRPDKTDFFVQCLRMKPSDCQNGTIGKSKLYGCDVCVKLPDKELMAKCYSDYDNKRKHINEKLISPDSWLPECTPNGLYEAKQLVGSKAICVNENGTRIFGQTEKALSANVTCGCSRYLAKEKSNFIYTWSINRREHCSLSGDYEKLQCVGDICYCSNPITGRGTGPVTPISLWKLLPCYDKTKHGQMYEKRCEKEMIRTSSLKYQFYRKGIVIIGLDDVDCDFDGEFSSRQCLIDSCFCVGMEGLTLKSYKKVRNGSESTMTCRCARDEYLSEKQHAQYPKMRCDEEGNYYPVQCFENECLCVDGEGAIIQHYSKSDPSKTDEKMLKSCTTARRRHSSSY